MNTLSVNSRELMRNQHTIVKQVQNTQQPVVIVSNTVPQAAIVSLEDLEKLAILRRQEALKQLEELSAEIAEHDQTEPFPTGTSNNHDYYLYQAYQENRKNNI